MKLVNIGILAHIDAGKTSLTERLLFDHGVIDSLGSVDAGTTQTDSNEIERRRGITIRTAVASFAVGDLQVNLIDTPGHSEFIAEVERALKILDGAVLVLSAVEGVQAQTRVIMKTLQTMRLPTLIFINKIDRMGARGDELLAEMRSRLCPRIIPMNRVENLGTAAVRTAETWARKPMPVAEILADNDEALLADLVSGKVPNRGRLLAMLAGQTAAGLAYPAFFGSARGGQGVPELVGGVRDLLPSASNDEAAAVQGTTFAIERGKNGEKTAYVRLFSGTVRARDHVRCFRHEADGTVTEHFGQVSGLDVIGGAVPGPARRGTLTAGNIAKIRGLPAIRVGDRIGSPGTPGEQEHFARPSLETLVRPLQRGNSSRLHAALLTLAEQDPLISTRTAADGRTSVLLYGEIQKEIIAETLARDFGVDAIFEPSQTVYLERVAGCGAAIIEMGKSPFVAGVVLRIEAAPAGSGVVFQRDTELGALPLAFHRAIQDTVRQALTQGLYGWVVTDCTITLIHTAFDNACSTGSDFRNLTPLVLMQALIRAATKVYEPCHSFEVEVPADLLTPITTRLLSLEARIRDTAAGPTTWIIAGDIPARQVHAITTQLPELTSGEGVWWSRADGDRLLNGPAPTRARTDGNPLNAAEYLFHLSRRVR